MEHENEMNPHPFKEIIQLAARIGGILALPILLIGALYWLFSPGSFDALWNKLNQVSGDQTFILLLVIFLGFIFLVFGLAFLWYSLEKARLQRDIPAGLSQDNRELLNEKIARLRRALILETDASEKFRLEYELAELEGQLKKKRR